MDGIDIERCRWYRYLMYVDSRLRQRSQKSRILSKAITTSGVSISISNSSTTHLKKIDTGLIQK